MPELDKMTNEELRALIKTLNEKIAALERENEELKASLNKNSKNSSRPPSKDGFKRTPNSREKTGNKPGGVEGHEGHRIEKPENYQELIDKGLAKYELEDHTGGSEEYVSRWVIDIKVTPVFTEHRFKRGEVPAKYKNEVIYGEEIKALSIELTEEGMVSAERLAEIFSSVTNGVVHPTKAAILGFEKELADMLDPEIKAIKADIQNAPIVHVDDSPMKSTQTVVREEGKEDVYKTAKGTTFNVYTRTYSTQESTIFTVNPKKDQKGVERDGIITDYENTLMHDHESKFLNYGGRHGECNAHPCRELKGLAERGIGWAGEMREFLLQMNEYKNNDLSKKIEACDPAVLKRFDDQYKEMLIKGYVTLDKLDPKSGGYDKLRLLLKRFRKYEDAHMLFMHDYAVPFTNNLAERDLRAEKTKEKVSGCFRSWSGIEGYMKIRSFISTVKKRGLNIIDSLRSEFKGGRVFA